MTQTYSAAQPNALSLEGKLLLHLMVKRSEKNVNNLTGKLCFIEKQVVVSLQSNATLSEARGLSTSTSCMSTVGKDALDLLHD